MKTVNELDYIYRKLVVKSREKRNNTIDISDEDYTKYYEVEPEPIESTPGSDIPIPDEEVKRLIIDNNIHQDSTLAAAMTPYSGVFTKISIIEKSGAKYFKFENNQGISSESIFNEYDYYQSKLLEENNCIIVGYEMLTDPPQFYCFNGICPNCTGSHILQLLSNGHAVCPNCGREYDLNNGGNAILYEYWYDEANNLLIYKASTTGSYGVLIIN